MMTCNLLQGKWLEEVVEAAGYAAVLEVVSARPRDAAGKRGRPSNRAVACCAPGGRAADRLAREAW